MMHVRTAALLGALSLALSAAASAQTAPAPVRHLVYAFTYSNAQSQTIHDSGIGNSDAANPKSMGGGGSLVAGAPASGVASSGNSVTDRGTISVDILRVQPDTGLVLNISEKANDRRSSLAATCVVYGNTNVICDPNMHINSEELTLLRLLGSNFVDPVQIDAKNHWRVDQSGVQDTNVADYTIDRNDNGAMDISSLRTVKVEGAQGFTSTVNGKIAYDFTKTVPIKIVEDETLRQNNGAGSYTTVLTNVGLELTTDTAAKATP